MNIGYTAMRPPAWVENQLFGKTLSGRVSVLVLEEVHGDAGTLERLGQPGRIVVGGRRRCPPRCARRRCAGRRCRRRSRDSSAKWCGRISTTAPELAPTSASGPFGWSGLRGGQRVAQHAGEEGEPVGAGAHRGTGVGPEARLGRVLGMRHEADDVAARVGEARDVVERAVRVDADVAERDQALALEPLQSPRRRR